MYINATEELIHILDDIDAKIKRLENSPNRTFVLIEYETLFSFHWFNLCFKQFWDEFDRNSLSQLLLFQKIVKTYSDLSNRYASLFREQIDYLESVIDFEFKCVNELPPVIFGEDYYTDVIGYYYECCKNEKDEEGKPLYEIELDSETNYENIDGKDVPIDYYMFKSGKINDEHYNGVLGIYNCLKRIFTLMCAVRSYPDQLLSDYKPNQEEIIKALDNGLRKYAKEVGKDVERDLKKITQELKSSRSAPLTPDVWGRLMEREDDMFNQAINTQVGEIEDKYLENISATKEQLIKNYSLLEKIKTTCIDDELFDIRLSVETHQLLTSLNVDNIDLFYELVLRRNIIHREMFPDELREVYEEWVNTQEEQQSEDDADSVLSSARQSKLDDIIEILKKGNWKEPATADNIELLLNTIFGNDTSLLDEEDVDECEKMWAFVERGGGDRNIIVPAKLAGFLKSENLIIGGPKAISDDLFGINNNQVNAINKGKLGCSNDFDAIIPFLKKYIDKIIRQG